MTYLFSIKYDIPQKTEHYFINNDTIYYVIIHSNNNIRYHYITEMFNDNVYLVIDCPSFEYELPENIIESKLPVISSIIKYKDKLIFDNI